MELRYFKRRWTETRGDEFDNWGFSNWLFETDYKGMPLRQLESYDNGMILKYDSNKPFDEYGQLGVHELDLDEFKEFEISKDIFDKFWNE